MKKQSRYIILFFNEDPFNFSFFKPDENILLTRPLDLGKARNLLMEDERIKIPLITKGEYSVIGILKENPYFTLRSNNLLAHLQRNKLIYGTNIQKNSIIGYSCLFTTFKEALLNNYHIESGFSKNFYNNFELISLSYKEENLITDIEFKKEDFQPILFTHDVYFKTDEVQSIYKDISNLYDFITQSFNHFLQQSSINEKFKNTHFLNITPELQQYFSNFTDVIIFNDYLQLLENKYSDKYQASFMKSMLIQEDPVELSKIKNYLSLKSSDSDIEYYIMQVLLSPLSLNDSLLINIKKKEYAKLINGFIKKI